MATIIASQSATPTTTQAVSVTSSSFPFDPAAVLTAVTTDSPSAPPTQASLFALQLSVDNINWITVDQRLCQMGAGAQSFQIFELSNFAGNSSTFGGGSANPMAWQNMRVLFTCYGNPVTVAVTSSTIKATQVVPLVGNASTSGGGIASWTPPQGGAGIVVTRCTVNITTKSTGAANLSAGVAANATTSATNLITASAVGGAAVVLDSINLQITATTPTAVAMASGSAVTFTGSATTVGMVGTAYIEYLLP